MNPRWLCPQRYENIVYSRYVTLYMYLPLTSPVWEKLRQQVIRTLLLSPARLSRFVRQMVFFLGGGGETYLVA